MSSKDLAPVATRARHGRIRCDLLSRIIWGARVSLQVGLAAVVVGFTLGVPLGIMAGFLGGRIEMTIMRFTDMLMAFPTLLLALLIVAALGGSLVNEIVAIGIALTPNFTRLARSLALTTAATTTSWPRGRLAVPPYASCCAIFCPMPFPHSW